MGDAPIKKKRVALMKFEDVVTQTIFDRALHNVDQFHAVVGEWFAVSPCRDGNDGYLQIGFGNPGTQDVFVQKPLRVLSLFFFTLAFAHQDITGFSIVAHQFDQLSQGDIQCH